MYTSLYTNAIHWTKTCGATSKIGDKKRVLKCHLNFVKSWTSTTESVLQGIGDAQIQLIVDFKNIEINIPKGIAQ